MASGPVQTRLAGERPRTTPSSTERPERLERPEAPILARILGLDFTTVLILYSKGVSRRITLSPGGEQLSIAIGVGTLVVGHDDAHMVTTSLGRTADGHRLEVATEIDAPAADLWDLLTRTSRWPEWGPLVTDVSCDVDRIGTGTTGTLKTTFGLDVPFRITSCLDFRWTWDLFGITATGHRVEPLNDHSRVVFEVPLLAAGYSPVCAVALEELAELA